jgi:hypothetical protein
MQDETNLSLNEIEEMTNEYIERKGFVTCEFSTSEEKLKELQPFLDQMNLKLAAVDAMWKSGHCNVCSSYSQLHTIHAEILGIEERHPFDDGE